jgi:predicted glycogen debranching enzyme
VKRAAARAVPARATSVLEDPIVSFGREICGDLNAATRREWIVTNGLGGYASGTLAGVNTRRYHGLLVAALTPPVERTVLVGGLVEWASVDGRRYPLATHEYGDHTIDPRGYVHQRAFFLDGMLPVWVYEFGDALLEKRIWMAHGTNTTFARYRLVAGERSVALEVTPLVTYRDFHALRSGQGWEPEITPVPGGLAIRASAGAVPYRLLCGSGRCAPAGFWYRNFLHREETARGLDDRSDLYAPGTFHVSLAPGESATLVATADAAEVPESARALEDAQARQRDLLQRAGADGAHRAVQQLTLAADQFVVNRRANGRAAPAVIAGYHWFNDWGRDTMVALPGLALSTNRPEVAAEILRAFSHYVADGLLPNNFPDRAGESPGYNTVDASLWYVLAVRAYHEATRDDPFVDEVLPVLREILDRYAGGTRYGIGVDPADGLLRAGQPGLQLTWTDAKVGDWVVSPRIGKPVEINALWYNALRTVAGWLAVRQATAARRYERAASRALASFRARFVQRDRPGLADVVDGPDGDDLTVRPNQIFAVSLPFPLLEGAAAAAVVDAVGRVLLSTYGLRSLSPDDPGYHGDYRGDVVQRDGAYHQGPVWAWLIGAYVEAHYRVHGDLRAARGLLEVFEHHLRDAGCGTISEIFEGDPPHLPRGCIAQAWSVAEVLRVWRALGRLETMRDGRRGHRTTSGTQQP